MAEEKQTNEVKKIVPPVDIYETDNDIILLADMPGVTKENLHVDVNNEELTINGLFLEDEDNNSNKLVKEYICGQYLRTFTLSDLIAQDKINAKLDNGVLTVTLPKQEKVKPRKIEIEAG